MDAQARNKALFRAKLKAQKKDKCLDSPLVRYNESNQPVCRVCDVVLKSESQWDAHQASRKHHEAINNLKANAARLTQSGSAKPGLPTEFFDSHGSGTQEDDATKLVEKSTQTLPTKALQSQNEMDESDRIQAAEPYPQFSKLVVDLETKRVKGALPEDFFDKTEARSSDNVNKAVGEHLQRSTEVTAPETKHPKGALPEGFFDNKEADLLARGIKPVKVDVKDEYKEFEKLIQEDLQEVDNRMEEEEIDAAEMIEEAESLEQKVCKEKVELLRKRKVEVEASRLAKRVRDTKVDSKESNEEESSSDDDIDDNFVVDWRAQHL